MQHLLEPFALRIFGQDASILRAQAENIRRFGGEQYMSTELDFLGPMMTWKKDWTPRSRPHHWLYIFGNTARATMLRQAKFSVKPVAKPKKQPEQEQKQEEDDTGD